MTTNWATENCRCSFPHGLKARNRNPGPATSKDTRPWTEGPLGPGDLAFTLATFGRLFPGKVGSRWWEGDWTHLLGDVIHCRHPQSRLCPATHMGGALWPRLPSRASSLRSSPLQSVPRPGSGSTQGCCVGPSVGGPPAVQQGGRALTSAPPWESLIAPRCTSLPGRAAGLYRAGVQTRGTRLSERGLRHVCHLCSRRARGWALLLSAFAEEGARPGTWRLCRSRQISLLPAGRESPCPSGHSQPQN